MTAYQLELVEELRVILDELSGDILALENFCHCCNENAKIFSLSASNSYLQRIKDYIHQHTEEIEQAAGFLCKDVRSELNPETETGQVP